jgi:hypothetical protein
MKTPDHIKDLKPDPRNARKHNPRNIGMVEESLQEVGAARSIVIDESNTVLAGNGVLEAAGNAGITKLKVVDADGSTIIAVRRTGLTAKQKTRLALFDNRAAELAEWDTEALAQMMKDDPAVLNGQFSDDEMADLLDEASRPIQEQVEDLKPIKRLHVLVSMTADQAIDLLPQIESLIEKKGAQIYHAGN